MKADRKYVDHRQQHKRVYLLDQDYDDVLEEIEEKNPSQEIHFLFTQNSKWKIKWNNYIGGIHSSDKEEYSD
jgi:hypothetical protein